MTTRELLLAELGEYDWELCRHRESTWLNRQRNKIISQLSRKYYIGQRVEVEANPLIGQDKFSGIITAIYDSEIAVKTDNMDVIKVSPVDVVPMVEGE